MAKFRFHITISERGAAGVAEENAEALLDGFARTHPKAAAAVEVDTAAETLSVLYSVRALTFTRAWAKGRVYFLDAAGEAGIRPAPLQIKVYTPRSRFHRNRNHKENSWRLPDEVSLGARFA